MTTVGQYRIIRELGRGGVGVVYLGCHVEMGREDAVKILLPEYAGDQHLMRVILDDARTAAGLDHENIATIYTIGMHDGRPYYAMELLKGEWLDQRLLHGPVDPKAASRIAGGVAQALSHAHKRKIAHLDVKPHNIHVERGGRVVLTDFGISRRFREDQRTHHGGVVGTPAYMAPEQLDSKAGKVGAPTDVYSLGAVVFQMLTGKLPFDGETIWSVVGQHLQPERPRPSERNPRLGKAFDGPVMRAMARSPRRRHRHVMDFARELESAVNPPPPPPPQDGRRLAVGVAAVMIILTAMLGSFLWPDTQAATPGPAESVGPLIVSTATLGAVETAPAATNPVDANEQRPSTDTPPPVRVLPTRPSALFGGGSAAVGRTIHLLSPPPDSTVSGCIRFDWRPVSLRDEVLVCFGERCEPTMGIYVGEGPMQWDPRIALVNRADLAGDHGHYRWRVAGGSGQWSRVGSLVWVGGECERRQPDRKDSANR